MANSLRRIGLWFAGAAGRTGSGSRGGAAPGSSPKFRPSALVNKWTPGDHPTTTQSPIPEITPHQPHRAGGTRTELLLGGCAGRSRGARAARPELRSPGPPAPDGHFHPHGQQRPSRWLVGGSAGQRRPRRCVGVQQASVHPGHSLTESSRTWTFLPPPERQLTEASGHGGCIAEPKMRALLRGYPPAGGQGFKCRRDGRRWSWPRGEQAEPPP